MPDSNQGGAIYPGAMLDDGGSNDFVWLASGIIHSIRVHSGNLTGIPKIGIYDFCSAAGVPHGEGKRYRLDAGSNKQAKWGAFECASLTAAADDRQALVAASSREVERLDISSTAVEDPGGTPIVHVNKETFEFNPESLCPAGMAIHTIGTVVGDILIGITYTPHVLGAYRKKVSLALNHPVQL